MGLFVSGEAGSLKDDMILSLSFTHKKECANSDILTVLDKHGGPDIKQDSINLRNIFPLLHNPIP